MNESHSLKIYSKDQPIKYENIQQVENERAGHLYTNVSYLCGMAYKVLLHILDWYGLVMATEIRRPMFELSAAFCA